MNIIDTDFTDESGRSKSFILPTIDKDLSQSEYEVLLKTLCKDYEIKD